MANCGPGGGGAVLPVALYESLQPRFSPELSLRNRIWTLWLWVLMGPGALSPQKGPKTFGPALICEEQGETRQGNNPLLKDDYLSRYVMAPKGGKVCPGPQETKGLCSQKPCGLVRED